MKHRFAWASALTLAAIISSQIQTPGLTNGCVVISTRTAQDALYRQISSSTLYDSDDFKGPGAFAPGDATMATLLQDHGYVTRLVPEWLLRTDCYDPYGYYYGQNPEYYYGGGGGPTKPSDTNFLYAAQLVIISGSGSSFDMPMPNTNGIPIIMGEHSCLGDQQLNGFSSIYMYGLKNSGDTTFNAAATPGDVQWMKVVAPNHPIMQGIPLDAQGRVKIWRDPYPEENAHIATGGKVNYLGSWLRVTTNGTTVVAAGTQIIGLQGNDSNNVVFAVNPAGAALYDGTGGGTAAPPELANHGNFVHFFVNERGSGDSRRAFCNLTDLGKVIFIRTCKWAMGETLQPYQPLGLIQVSRVPSTTQIQLAWLGLSTKNYKILGTRNILGPDNYNNWQTVAQDIKGVAGPTLTTAKLDISGAGQYTFLRVMPVP